MTSTTDLPVLDHWIGGAAVAGESTRTGPVYDPALGEVTKHVRFASAADVDAAVATARAAFSGATGWGSSSIAKRQTVMFAFRELLNARRDELAAILTSEHGKVLSDAAGEVARGLEVVEFACGMPHLAKGAYSENASTDVDVYSVKEPLGVVGIISPFNFPAMVPMWFFPIAIATGNTVVLKPSEKDPSRRQLDGRAVEEAGLPDGVLNVVHGDKEAVDALLVHPDVASISFVGSTPIAQYVYETGTAARQARAGPRRRQEPHAGAARRRPRPGRRLRRQRRLRLGRRALHGDLGRARGRPDRRRARRARSATGWASSSPATAAAAATWAR